MDLALFLFAKFFVIWRWGTNDWYVGQPLPPRIQYGALIGLLAGGFLSLSAIFAKSLRATAFPKSFWLVRPVLCGLLGGLGALNGPPQKNSIHKQKRE